MNKNLIQRIEQEIGESILESLSGNSRIKTASGRVYFLKTGAASNIYRCEANGLKELAKTGEIRIAKVVSVGEDYILTEFIESGSTPAGFQGDFGKALARLHRFRAPAFGFYENNYIGANVQLNIAEGEEQNDWVTFYFNKRLSFQYRLAERNGFASENLRKGFLNIENQLSRILEGSEEPPTLLHGDLWAGNYLCDTNGKAVLIDPAVYYGHREADLAMTKVFGGFDHEFYKAYMSEFPLKDGWEQREGIYKLYHILNHLNIFGRSYLPEAEFILKEYQTGL